MDKPEQTIRISYDFAFRDGSQLRVDAELDAKGLHLLNQRPSHLPAWTRLDNVACQACPLRAAGVTHCPVAVNLVDIIERFDGHVSHEPVDVRVTTKERTIAHHTTLQHALSSLTGIFMVTAGCPVMDKLRPMVRFHLPFASFEETTYRAVSMYLLSQFLRLQSGETPDWSLKGLDAIYREVHEVNCAIGDCIRQAAKHDASANALVRLDLFTNTVALSLSAALKDLTPLFAPYLRPSPAPAAKCA